MPGALESFLALGHGPWLGGETLHGGCISRSRRLVAADGFAAVLKDRSDAPHLLYRREAEGLDALRSIAGWQVPLVYGHGPGWLLLEDLGPQAPGGEPPFPDEDPAWEVLGRALAHCHGRQVAQCGWPTDTWWGLLRFDNRPRTNGHDFYRETRFAFLLGLPGCQARLGPADRAGVDGIIARLDRLVPAETPCLNHGDLWAGNRLRGHGGRPAVIDPFIQYGHPACDLHNCIAYGGFPPRFFDAYRECHHLAPDWRAHAEVFCILHCLACIAQDIECAYHIDWLRRLLRRYG